MTDISRLPVTEYDATQCTRQMCCRFKTGENTSLFALQRWKAFKVM